MTKDVYRIRELVELLNKYRDSYYNDSVSPVSDYEYDTLYDELEQLENKTGIIMTSSPTQSVGYEVKSKLEKVSHSHPMLSLGKTKSEDDLKSFAGDKECMLSLKMDGLTVLLTYEGGELVKAETRGNGEIGEDITHNAMMFENIPKYINNKGKYEIEGEAIITYSDFDEINSKLPEDEQYKNPRNLASGSVRQLNNRIAKDRHIKFIAWKVPSDKGFNSVELSIAAGMGFEVVPFRIYDKTKDLGMMIEYLKSFANDCKYPIDGLVMTYDDIEYGKSLGMTGHHPKHSVAYKFYDEEVITTIRDIEFSMGKTGELCPVAIFDDVDIDGTTVNRASLHNLSICKDLRIGIGDEIAVYKANMIIPQVRESLTKSGNFTIPDTCPVCGGKTKIENSGTTETLVCTNPNCKGKLLGKLTHAVSKNALNIDGLSESTISKLMDLEWLESIDDIYYLYDHEYEMKTMEGFGTKSVSKLLYSIECSRSTTLDRFLYALSIPLVGRTASKAISKYCGGDFDKFISIVDDMDWTQLDDFGNGINNSMHEYFSQNKDDVIVLSNHFIFEIPEISNESNKLEGKTFVITGSLNHYSNRNELTEVITSMGGKVSGSVSSKTDYLINNDTESSSSKNKKAKSLGVPIISEEDFLSLINS